MIRHFLSSDDLAAGEQDDLLGRALALKAQRRAPVAARRRMPLEGMSVGLLFEKPSTRTRVSFEVAVAEMGGRPVVLRGDELQLGRGETIQDTGRVLSRYLDAIVIRTFAQARVEELADASTIPVVNALSDAEHPCQALADLMTIRERFERCEGLRLAYVGDGNNVCHSLLIAGAKAGLGSISVASPAGFEPLEPVVERASVIAKETGGSIEITNDPSLACRGANAIYTDVWTSMGQETEAAARVEAFEGFRVTAELVSLGSPGVIVMHCLPAHRGQEIDEEVIDGESSAVWDQAENRLHTQKALLEWLLR